MYISSEYKIYDLTKVGIKVNKFLSMIIFLALLIAQYIGLAIALSTLMIYGIRGQMFLAIVPVEMV